MKRKKPVVASTVQKAPDLAAAAPNGPDLGIVWTCLFSILLFLAMTVQTGRMTVVLLVLAFALSVGKTPMRNLRQHLSIPLVGLLAFAFMQGFAALYSDFGSYAVKEYPKFLAAFALAVILLVRFEKKHVRGLLWGLAAICAALSVLCVDAACDGSLFWGFNGFIELLGGSFADLEQLADRVNGLYNDANVSASILALGTLVSLHLADSETRLWRRAAACLLLGMSAMGFFLSMSRGAILCFALALLVWLIAAGKGERLSLFFLMAVSALVTVGLSIPAMSAIADGATLPTLLTLVSGLPIFVLDWGVTARLARLLNGRGKAVAAVVAVLAVICIGYGIAALTVTGPYTFDESGYLNRTVELAPGEYTLTGEWDGEPTLWVYAYDKTDILRRTGTTTVLYMGPLKDASFTVAGDEARLSIRFEGEKGGVLREVTFSDGTKVALGYPLLPLFVANRLQDDLMTSNSFLQRIVFFKDGWKLFLESPLIGHGLGSTEGLLTSVQSYYYESKYVHNHILQVMDEMGLVGLAAFLAVLGGGLWLLLRRLRAKQDGLAAMLAACWVMINAHSLMELNFSIRAFQCVAFTLLLLPILLYAEGPSSEAAPALQKRVKWGGVALAGSLWLYLVVFGGLYESHRMVVREADDFSATNIREFLDGIKSFTSRDVFDHEDFQVTYVANAASLNDSRYNGTVQKYVKELRASGTYPACSGLARYYYLPRGEYAELFACSREGIAQEASAKESWNLQFEFYREEVLPAMGEEGVDMFLDEVLQTRDYLETYSEGRLEEIALTGENQAFLEEATFAKESGMSGKAAYLYLSGAIQADDAETSKS